MRIAFFTNTYFPISYGSTISIDYFKKGLEKLGHEVFIFAPEFKNYEDASEKVFRYPAVMWKYKIKYPLAFTFGSSLDEIFKKINPDIVHAHQPFSIGQKGLDLAKKNNVPIVFTHHCLYEDYSHYVPLFPQGIVKKYVKQKATKFANQCEQVIAPTKEIEKLIRSRGVKSPITILPSGINWKKFQKENRQKIRNLLGVKENEILLFNVGRMEEEKNLLFMFEAVAVVLKNNLNVKFLMAGEGTIKERLIKKAGKLKLYNQIIFSGFIPQDEIEDYFSAADIFLQTSTTETQGIILNEAMAAGLPIVAIKATGAVDIIKDENGILTENSQEAYQKALADLIADENLRKTISQKARQDAKNYDYEIISKQLEKIYLDLVGRQK